MPQPPLVLPMSGFVSQQICCSETSGLNEASLRVSLYFASSVPQEEKSQQVPPNWLLTVEFQFCPLTLCQQKLSANAPGNDRHSPIAKSATVNEIREKSAR